MNSIKVSRTKPIYQICLGFWVTVLCFCQMNPGEDAVFVTNFDRMQFVGVLKNGR